MYLEEPEFWAAAGYSEGFKRQWAAAYGEAWAAPDSSADAQLRASRLKAELYRRALERVFGFVRAEGARTGRRIKCYVAAHSPINYARWGIISPGSGLARVGADGYIAQVWTGTAATPNVYQGRRRSRVFKTAFLEYGADGQPGADRRRRAVVPPAIRSRTTPTHSWEYYPGSRWESTLIAGLLWPGVHRYEVMPWPERVLRGRYPSVDRPRR